METGRYKTKLEEEPTVSTERVVGTFATLAIAPAALMALLNRGQTRGLSTPLRAEEIMKLRRDSFGYVFTGLIASGCITWVMFAGFRKV